MRAGVKSSISQRLGGVELRGLTFHYLLIRWARGLESLLYEMLHENTKMGLHTVSVEIGLEDELNEVVEPLASSSSLVVRSFPGY